MRASEGVDGTIPRGRVRGNSAARSAAALTARAGGVEAGVDEDRLAVAGRAGHLPLAAVDAAGADRIDAADDPVAAVAAFAVAVAAVLAVGAAAVGAARRVALGGVGARGR